MYGRYGADQLGNFLFVFYIILAILSFVYPPIMILCYATIIYSLFRMFSKQYYKRRAENEWYLNKTEGIRKFFNRQKNQWKYRKTHKVFWSFFNFYKGFIAKNNKKMFSQE